MKGPALHICRGEENHPQTLRILCPATSDADRQDTVVNAALGSPGSGQHWRARGRNDDICTLELTARAGEGCCERSTTYAPSSVLWSPKHPVGSSQRPFIYMDSWCNMAAPGLSLCFFSPLQRCLETVEGWVGSVSAKHSYISPIENSVIVGAGLSLEFLESVPKITFYRCSEDRGQGRRAVLHPWQQAACGWGLGEHPQLGLPCRPPPALWSCRCRSTSQCGCRSSLTIRQLADS